MPRTKLKLADDTKRPPAHRVTFNKANLEAIPVPESGETVAYDTKQNGLAFRVRSSGARAFYFIRKHRGRVKRLKLGDYDTTTVDQARRAAVAELGDIHRGIDPAEKRRVARAAMTLGEFFRDIYLPRHAVPHKRTWPEDERQYQRHLIRWQARQLDQITRDEVMSLHARVGKAAPVAANRLIALVSAIYNVATDHGYTGTNPARRIKKYKEADRERFLDADELPRFLAAVDADISPIVRDYLKVALFTGGRRANVASMTWHEIDFKRGAWVIPASKFKTDRDMVVPLVPAVVSILKARQKDATGPYVFPNRKRSGAVGHLTEPKAGFSRVCKAAGIENLRLHDLRRTLGSWANMQGIPYTTVAAMLGHKAQGTTSIYARLDIATLRKAFETTVSAMLATTKAKHVKKKRRVKKK